MQHCHFAGPLFAQWALKLIKAMYAKLADKLDIFSLINKKENLKFFDEIRNFESSERKLIC